MGIDEYFAGAFLCLVEWPEKGEGLIPEPDITITLSMKAEGRCLVLSTISALGEKALKSFSPPLK